MATLETFTQRAQELIGNIRPGSATLDVFVDQAKAKVDRARPRYYRNAITGDGSDEYTLPSPWQQHFSTIDAVDILDSDGSEDDPTSLLPEEWQVEQNTSGADQIRLYGYSPGSTETLVVYHTAPHTVDSSTSTILSSDEEAFSELVAALILRAALARVLSSSDQRTDTDRAAIDIAQAEQIASLYRELKKTAYSHFGIRDEADPIQSVPRQASRDADRLLGYGTIRRYRHTHYRKSF